MHHSTGEWIGIGFGIVLVLMLIAGYLIRVFARKRKETSNLTELLLTSKAENIKLRQVWNISYDEIMMEQELGRGTFGVVYKGKWRDIPVAVKVLRSHMILGSSFILSTCDSFCPFFRNSVLRSRF